MGKPKRSHSRAAVIDGVLIVFSLILFINGANLPAQEPLGEPDEAWVTTSAGDIICVGQPIALEVYIANSQVLDGANLTFALYSSDGADWEWIDQAGNGTYGVLELIEDSRFALGLDFYNPGWAPSSPSGAPADTFCLAGISFTEPHMEPGPLERTFNLHIRSTHAGTLCIDHSCIPPSGAPWLFVSPGGAAEYPAWNGPICFTVIDAVPGDVNCDGNADVGDAVYLINWIFRGGPEPCK